MSGDVWVGSNPTTVRQSLIKMNQDAHTSALDGYSQATALNRFNITQEVKRVHVDAIATNNVGHDVGTIDTIEKQFHHWNGTHHAALGQLSPDEMRSFVTSPIVEGGLGLSSGYYEDAYHFSALNYGIGHNNDWNFFSVISWEAWVKHQRWRVF